MGYVINLTNVDSFVDTQSGTDKAVRNETFKFQQLKNAIASDIAKKVKQQ